MGTKRARLATNDSNPQSPIPNPYSFRLPPFVFRLPLLALLSLWLGCAGYQVGNQTLYPANIRTVYVPVFESVSFRRNLGERLTEAVIKEIERRTPYKVTGRSDADSILTGRIVGDAKHLVVQTRNSDPREVEVNLRVEVSWVERGGNPICPIQGVSMPAELTDVSASATLVPEVGQSVTTAQQKAIHRLAQQIVDLMEAPW